MNEERRKSERWEVSIPCTVTFMDEIIRGRIANISLGGAFITELATSPPPEKALVTVTFQVNQVTPTQRNNEIKASIGSSIVRNLYDIRDDEIVGSIGVKFQDHSSARLKSVMSLISKS